MKVPREKLETVRSVEKEEEGAHEEGASQKSCQSEGNYADGLIAAIVG